MREVAKVMFQDKSSLFDDISLSRNSIARRIEDISEDLSGQLSLKTSEFQCFSLAFDESGNTTDTAQMLVFIHGVTTPLSVHKDLLELISLHCTTRGSDVKEVLKQLCDRVPDLPLSKIIGLTRDGLPSMTGKENGAVAFLKKHLGNQSLSKIFLLFIVSSTKRHFVLRLSKNDACNGNSREIRERNTCKRVKISAVSVVLKNVNAQYKDLIYHSEVRWLSRRKVLERFFALEQK